MKTLWKSVYSFVVALVMVAQTCAETIPLNYDWEMLPWSEDIKDQVACSDLIVVAKVLSMDMRSAGSSWLTHAARLEVSKVLKGELPKLLVVLTDRMEKGEDWQFNSMWALDYGIFPSGKDGRKKLIEMQTGAGSFNGKSAVLFLRRFRERWRLVSYFKESDKAAYENAISVVVAQKDAPAPADSPLQWSISLPDKTFSNKGVIPVRCKLTNVGPKRILLDDMGFPNMPSVGMLPILTSRDSLLQALSDEGKMRLFPDRIRYSGPGSTALEPGKSHTVWIDLRDYFYVPQSEWSLTISLSVSYTDNDERYDRTNPSLRHQSFLSESLKFSVGNAR